MCALLPSALQKAHIHHRHSIETPEDTDMFTKADQPVDAVQCHVYVVPDKYIQNPDALPEDVVEALETGRAVFEGEFIASLF